jgi:hypothetical protein
MIINFNAILLDRADLFVCWFVCFFCSQSMRLLDCGHVQRLWPWASFTVASFLRDRSTKLRKHQEGKIWRSSSMRMTTNAANADDADIDDDDGGGHTG